MKHVMNFTVAFLVLPILFFSCATNTANTKKPKEESYQTNTPKQVWARVGDIVFSEIEIPKEAATSEKEVIYKIWRFSKSSSATLTFTYEQYNKYSNYQAEKMPLVKKDYNFAATQKKIPLGSQILTVQKFDGKQLWYTLQKK